MLGSATIVGWTPSEFWNATYTDLQDAMQGWNEAHGAAKKLTGDDVAQARAKMRAANERAQTRKRTEKKPAVVSSPTSEREQRKARAHAEWEKHR